jgi:hypothetical protein
MVGVESLKEPLINSESFSCVGKMCQIKAPIAGKTQSNRCSQSIRFAHGLGPAHGASFSMVIAKIGNAELVHFNKQMLIHELIRGSFKGFLQLKLDGYGIWNAPICPSGKPRWQIA